MAAYAQQVASPTYTLSPSEGQAMILLGVAELQRREVVTLISIAEQQRREVATLRVIAQRATRDSRLFALGGLGLGLLSLVVALTR